MKSRTDAKVGLIGKKGVAVLINELIAISERTWISDWIPEDTRGQADSDTLKFMNCVKPSNRAHLESTFYYFPKHILLYLVAKQPN